MARILMFVLAGGLVAAAGGIVYLGAFPPSPAAHEIQKVLPNDAFRTR